MTGDRRKPAPDDVRNDAPIVSAVADIAKQTARLAKAEFQGEPWDLDSETTDEVAKKLEKVLPGLGVVRREASLSAEVVALRRTVERQENELRDVRREAASSRDKTIEVLETRLAALDARLADAQQERLEHLQIIASFQNAAFSGAESLGQLAASAQASANAAAATLVDSQRSSRNAEDQAMLERGAAANHATTISADAAAHRSRTEANTSAMARTGGDRLAGFIQTYVLTKRVGMSTAAIAVLVLCLRHSDQIIAMLGALKGVIHG